MYRDNDGSLTDPAPYGNDPLAENHHKRQIKEQSFGERFSLETVFHKLVNGKLFCSTLMSPGACLHHNVMMQCLVFSYSAVDYSGYAIL